MPQLETHTGEYSVLRDTVAAASVDTDLTSTQKTWAYFGTNWESSGSTSWEASRKTNGVRVIFDFKNVNADTASFILYAYTLKGDAEFVCSGDLTAGAQANNDTTARYYADTIANFVQRWNASVKIVDAAGNDGIAKVSFDFCGYKHLICLFNAISSGDNVRAKAIGW